MTNTQSKTDWNRVLAYKESDQIAHEPVDGLYDPNDAEATCTWFAQADLIRKGKVERHCRRGSENHLCRPPKKVFWP